MDRSRITSAVAGVEFVGSPEDCAGADVVVIDLARRAADVAAVRAHVPAARIVSFGPHVDDARLENAKRDGADTAIARSRFFRDIASALGANA
jgi:hypothetical protein